MRQLIAVLITGMLVLLPGCARTTAVDLIAAAPDATTEDGSARMAMTMTIRAAGEEFSTNVDGAVDFGAQRASMTLQMGGAAAQAGMGSMEMVVDGTTAYLKVSNHQQLGLPTPWLQMDLEDMAGMEGLGDLQQWNSDPSQTMEMLRGVSDDVEEVGSEDLRGEQTTHYRATLDLERALDEDAEQTPERARQMIQQLIDSLGASTLPVEVWIDGEGRLRQQTFTLDLPGTARTQGQAFSMDMRYELFDFGTAVDVQPPPADAVTDFNQLQGGG